MNRKFVVGLVALMGGALVCIVLIQLFWIQHAYRENEKRFSSSVNEALDKVAGRLEEQENYSMLSRDIHINYSGPPDIPPPGKRRNEEFTIIYNDSLRRIPGHKIPTHIQKIRSSKTEDNQMTVVVRDSFPEIDIQPPDINENELDSLLVHMPPIHGIKGAKKRVKRMMNVFNQMVIEASNENLPIEKRLDEKLLRDELLKFLANKGIDLPFEYAVVQAKNDSLSPVHSIGFQKEFTLTPFKVSLFPNDFNLKPYNLLVFFPGRKAFIYKSFGWLMLSSVLFTLIIILAFAFTVHLLLKQKKLADIKSDFINNLTHEFKTPIATISVAIDSIENSKVIGHPEKILPITNMIRQENRRMNDHVEQVLQMALLDNGKLSLVKELVDIESLLQRAIEAVSLQVEKRGGAVFMDMKAAGQLVEGDEMHLYNVFLNLLDNANKYSPHSPEIRVETSFQGKMVCIAVRDNGIGMSKEVQKKIFERFYRIPTGNIHNVKGFGLGLSYAKAIIEAHSGTIEVAWSEVGKGSCLEVRLPAVPATV